MKETRRVTFLSAAQVALQYGYTLAEALALSNSERQLLLAVAIDAEEKRMAALGRLLGCRWDIQDLIEDKPRYTGDLPKEITLPLLPFVAPELFQNISKEYKAKVLAKQKSANSGMIEIGTLSVAEAKALLKDLEPPKD